MADEIIIGIATGAIFGIVTAVGGILKNKTSADYKGIDWTKAAPTILITAIAGGYMGMQGMALTDIGISTTVTGFAAVGITEWVNNWFKGFYGIAKAKLG